MKTEEIEALAKAYTEAVAKEHGCSPGSVTWDIAGLEAVARAVRAQDAARAGTLSAESIAQTRVTAESDPTDEWSSQVVLGLIDHSAAQGRANAALEAERDEARAELAKAQADALAIAQSAEESEKARITAESALATLRQAAQTMLDMLALEVKNTPQYAAAIGDARERLATAVNATPAEHPDTAGVRAIRELVEDYATRMDAKAAESDSVRQEPGERPTRMGSDALSIDCRARASAARDILKMLGDSGPSGGGKTLDPFWTTFLMVHDVSGPSGGGEKSCPNGKCNHPAGDHGVDNPGGTRLALVCCHDCPCGWDTAPGDVIAEGPDFRMTDAGNGYVRQESKPTTPPDGAASMDADMRSVMAMTPEQVDSELRASGVDPEAFTERMKKHVSTVRARLAASERPADVFAPMPDENAEPTPEEDWRTVEFIPGLLQTFGHMAMAEEMRKALARLKSEPRRAAEDVRDAALEELAQNFEMLTAGGKISGLDAADAVRRRKSQPARRLVDADDVRRAAEAMRERCAEEVRIREPDGRISKIIRSIPL